mmetsp:Transcript_15241/g.35945  ORF Transcript_15241/g.35945 Transcript_15241/m.35945 type:complete len:164 (-) Transcript_15241:8-499(-)
MDTPLSLMVHSGDEIGSDDCPPLEVCKPVRAYVKILARPFLTVAAALGTVCWSLFKVTAQNEDDSDGPPWYSRFLFGINCGLYFSCALALISLATERVWRQRLQHRLLENRVLVIWKHRSVNRSTTTIYVLTAFLVGIFTVSFISREQFLSHSVPIFTQSFTL